MNFVPGLALNHDPLISASQVARITTVSYQCPAENTFLIKKIQLLAFLLP
jgi:hypothetical protein